MWPFRGCSAIPTLAREETSLRVPFGTSCALSGPDRSRLAGGCHPGTRSRGASDGRTWNGTRRCRRQRLRAGRAALPRCRHRHAHVRAARRPGHDPGRDRAPAGRRRRGCPRPAEPVPGPLAQRGRSDVASDTPRTRDPADVADRRRRPDRRGARRSLPDDRLAQGAGGIRLPGAADRHRHVRSDRAARRLAVDRQLLPRRRRDLTDHGLSRRRRPARGDEPGALRLAGALGRRTRPTSSAPPAPKATSRRSTTAAPSSSATRRT